MTRVVLQNLPAGNCFNYLVKRKVLLSHLLQSMLRQTDVLVAHLLQNLFQHRLT